MLYGAGIYRYLPVAKDEIKKGIDGELWIMSDRQKTGANTNIPLLPRAIEIVEKYRDSLLFQLLKWHVSNRLAIREFFFD